jgi:xanthine/uracil permease
MTATQGAEKDLESKAATPQKQQVIWRNVILLTLIHLVALYGAIVIIPRINPITWIWSK